MLLGSNNHHARNRVNPIYKKSAMYLISIVVLFIFIGILTTIQPAYRFSSNTITEWTSDIDGSIFLSLLGMENRAFNQAYPNNETLPDISTTLFQIATSIKPNDPRSLLGNELPGYSIFDSQILIAGEGTNYTNLPVESSPPLEEVLRDREAVIAEESNDPEDSGSEEEDETTPSTGERDVVFLYNTHNRESFLPHLPDVTEPDQAFHDEVNITQVSDRLAESLEAKGIGTNVDDTDISNELSEKGMSFSQSYEASRDVVEEAFATNEEIQYVFDLHRDAVSRDITTKEINGKSYARIMIVVGAEHAEHEKNLEFATELHYLLEEKYPGLSRGVYPKEGSATNGVFNQDLSENSLVLEFGGVENNMEELNRSADALAEVFSELYWDAEEVDTDS
ncbi:stage II sporulation protein P [Virgibacillus sp. NKC19-16]|uniref:stage II sporulation protein P n=1 Tax=Virgibacillus salidurans TaxID=2831673 RepID=UPI001F18DAB8|nr:stage II sporulation protein P [Virgibacillus sp. NKC19-16]UJL44891.1 stage II sporulation protein P [Virgibacillus sp. NKC19-16]